jgi:predicted esterase
LLIPGIYFPVSKIIYIGGVIALLCLSAFAQQNGSPSIASPNLQTGIVLPDVTCAAQTDQSYALYLPSHYTPEKRWPTVYVFDPAARGSVPVELMKDAAERYGYIVAGSNNSRNGPWKEEAAAAQAMYHDTRERLSIDANGIYFAGLSGGARFAASLAQACKCAAGVLVNGAGFSPSSPPVAGGNFAVFGAVGTFDFNYGEMVQLDAKLGELHYAHVLERFDGTHEWAPANVMDEAFAWFRLIAMKDGREPRDEAFINEQAADAEKRAVSLLSAGDAYESWFEYRQEADTFAGLAQGAEFHEHAMALKNDKAVRAGAKREQQEIEEQSQMQAGILRELDSLREENSPETNQRAQLAQDIADLQRRAQAEKNAQKLRVLRRALGAVYIGAMEDGQTLYDSHDATHALVYFELAAIAAPDSANPLRAIAMARATNGDRRGALDALRRAETKSTNRLEFAAWLKSEPAFAKIRDTAEFRTLLQPAQAPQ